MDTSQFLQCTICLQNAKIPRCIRPTRKTRSSMPSTSTIQPWERIWTKNCAESVCKLLDLDLETFEEFFVSENQCSSCKQLLRDVDFVIRSWDSLNNRLSHLRIKVANLLYENIRNWTEEKRNARPDHSSMPKEHEAIPVSSLPIDYDDEDDRAGVEPEEDSKSGLLLFGTHTLDDSRENLTEPQALQELTGAPADAARFPPEDSRLCVPETDKDILNQANIQPMELVEQEQEASNDCSTITTKQEPRNVLVARLRNRVRRGRVSYREASEDEENANLSDNFGVNSKSDTVKTNAKRKSKNRHITQLKQKQTSASHQEIKANRELEQDVDSDPEFVIPDADGSSSEFEMDSEEQLKRWKPSPVTLKKFRAGRRKSVPTRQIPVKNQEFVVHRETPEGVIRRPRQIQTVIKSEPNVSSESVNRVILIAKKYSSIESLLKLSGPENEQIKSTALFLLQLEREEAEKHYTYICPSVWCGRRFIDFRKLGRHHIREHGEPLFPYQFQCPFCDQYFFRDYQLDAHIIKHHQGQKHGYVCSVIDCPFAFATYGRLLTHMSCRHPEILPEIPFPTNNPTLGHRNEYRDKSLVGSSEAVIVQRKGRQTEESRRQMFCPVEGCSVRRSSQLLLDRHYNVAHVQDPYPYKCAQLDCTKAFKGESSFARHMAVAHGITGKGTLLKCIFCNYKCLGQSMMNHHMRVAHCKNDAPKFHCKVCNLLFFVEEHCGEHEKLHTEAMAFNCVFQQCRTGESLSKEGLIEHVKRVHDGVGAFHQKHICPTCGVGKRIRFQLEVHMKSHTTDLPFKCNYCDTCFRNATNRKSHEEIMHGDQVEKKTYNCKLCDATFTAAQYLYKHNAWHKHGANANLPVARKKQTDDQEPV